MRAEWVAGVAALGPLAWAALAGCESEARLVLPPPAVPTAVSALLAVIDERGVEVIATPLDEPVYLSRPDQPLDARLELLLFERPLAALRLLPGPVPAATGDAGHRLPTAPFVYAADIVAGAASTWVPKPGPSAAVAAFRAATMAPSECERLVIEPVILPGAVSFAVSASADGRSIVFGDRDALWVMTGHDVTRLRTTLPPGFIPAAGGTTHTGDVVLVSEDGRVAFGAFDGQSLSLEETFTGTRTAARPMYVDGGFLEDGPEVFTLSRSGEVSQLSTGIKRVEPRFEALPVDGEYGGVVRVRSGSALVGAASSTQLWLSDRPAPIKSDVEGGVSAIGAVAGFGALVGTGRGDVLVEAQSYGSLGRTGSAFPITAFAPFGEDGFLFAGAQGALGYYTRTLGYCFDERASTELIPVWIIQRSDEWVLFGNKLLSQQSRAAFVRRPE